MKAVNLAVVGATGVVGTQMIKSLEELKVNVANFYAFSSARSAGTSVTFKGKKYKVMELKEDSFNKGIDYAIFSAGGDVSKKFAPIAAKHKVVVIDNSSAWRMDKNVPLVVPEINADALKKHKYIIANPNCSTIQSVLPLAKLNKKYGIKRIVYSTYQAVSGSGSKGIKDLDATIKGGKPTFYPKAIAYNVIPLIDVMQASGYTKEEEKMINETRKILNDQSINITATCVRVPVYYGHSVSVNVELKKPFDLKTIIKELKTQSGLLVVENDIPTPLHVAHQDLVYVGRIREDKSVKYGLNMWVVADNIRKGAATNAVQILKKMMEGK
jgi:aspartate-semialdehyde dehydrogenase